LAAASSGAEKKDGRDSYNPATIPFQEDPVTRTDIALNPKAIADALIEINKIGLCASREAAPDVPTKTPANRRAFPAK
jgi:hypothetical protein